MVNEIFEKQKAKELLNLINEYSKSEYKKEINKKINKLSDELYNQKKEILSQKMIDVALALFSFTEAAMSGGHFQPLDEFILDLQEIIKS